MLYLLFWWQNSEQFKCVYKLHSRDELPITITNRWFDKCLIVCVKANFELNQMNGAHKHQIDIQDNGNRQDPHWKHHQMLIKFQNDSNENLSIKMKKNMKEQTLMTGGSQCSHGRQNDI